MLPADAVKWNKQRPGAPIPNWSQQVHLELAVLPFNRIFSFTPKRSKREKLAIWRPQSDKNVPQQWHHRSVHARHFCALSTWMRKHRDVSYYVAHDRSECASEGVTLGSRPQSLLVLTLSWTGLSVISDSSWKMNLNCTTLTAVLLWEIYENSEEF